MLLLLLFISYKLNYMHKYRDILRIVPEVLYALKHGQPVVSL